MKRTSSWYWIPVILLTMVLLFYGGSSADDGTVPPRHPAVWEIDTLASTGSVGRYCSVRIDSAGDMHVVYLRDDTDQITTLSRLDGVWQPPQSVGEPDATVGSCAIAANGAGVLRVSWYTGATHSLLYAGPEDVDTWDIGQVSNSSDDIGRELSLHMTDAGDLSLACRNNTTESLLFMQREPAGTWTPPDTVDAGPNRGFYIDHTWRPGGSYAFSQYDDTDRMLLFVDSVLHQDEWEVGQVTSGSDDIGRELSLHRKDDGALSVSCLNYTTESLLFMQREPSGSWMAPDTVDAGPNRGMYSDHTWRPGGGYAFSEYGDGETMLLYLDPVLKSNTWKIGTVRTYEDAGRYVSATRMPDGHVACSYYTYDPDAKGSVHVAYNVGSDDFWVIQSVADSIALGTTAPVSSDLEIIDGWMGFVSFRNDIDDHLYLCHNDSVVTGIGDDEPQQYRPVAFALGPNYPNPFNPHTTFAYTLRESGRMRLAIYDVRGCLVRVLEEGMKLAGEYTVSWDGTGDAGQRVASGVYFVRLSSNGQYRAHKMVLLK